MNKITIIGNLTQDPQKTTTPSGVTVCTFNVAVNRKFPVNGEKVTDFFRVQTWRQLADVCGRYLTKGRKVAVIGELQARTYQGKDGQTHMSLDIQADEVEFLTDATKPAEPKHYEPEQGQGPKEETENTEPLTLNALDLGTWAW